MNQTAPVGTPPTIAPALLSAKDAAALVSVSARTITRAADLGELAAYRIGSKTVRYRTEDVIEWATRTPYVPAFAA